MKALSDTHPKAKLIAKKRSAILIAAREIFLQHGYEGASMEAIAAAAGVSIMTLYRHAESKDQLFAAVMLNACEIAQDEDGADSISPLESLREILLQVGNQFQDKLTRPATVSLFRTVMVETTRFPDLAEAAYRGLIESWEIKLGHFLSERPESDHIPESTRRSIISDFLNDLVGASVLRALLGLTRSSVEERARRTAFAVERLLTNL